MSCLAESTQRNRSFFLGDQTPATADTRIRPLFQETRRLRRVPTIARLLDWAMRTPLPLMMIYFFFHEDEGDCGRSHGIGGEISVSNQLFGRVRSILIVSIIRTSLVGGYAVCS